MQTGIFLKLHLHSHLYTKTFAFSIYLQYITQIETYTFLNCTAPTPISMTSGVTDIKEYAFYGCVNLDAIYFKGDALTNLYIEAIPTTTTAYYNTTNSGWGAYAGKKLGMPYVVSSTLTDLTIDSCNHHS